MIEIWGATWCPSCPGMKKTAIWAAETFGCEYVYHDIDLPGKPLPSGVTSLPHVEITSHGELVYSGGSVGKAKLKELL